GHFATAGNHAVAHEVVGGELAGAGEKPAVELELAHGQPLVGGRFQAGAPANQGDDFHLVAGGQLVPFVFHAGHDVAVDFDGHALAVEVQRVQELRDRHRS